MRLVVRSFVLLLLPVGHTRQGSRTTTALPRCWLTEDMQTPPAAVEAKSLPFHSCFVVDWLQSNFYIGDNGTLSKLAVYKEYCRLCEKNNWKPVACAVLGKLVHKGTFPLSLLLSFVVAGLAPY